MEVELDLAITSVLRPLFFDPEKRPCIFLYENPEGHLLNTANAHILKSQPV